MSPGLLILAMSALTSCGYAAPDLAGRASVVDGDTLEIAGQRIRLWGVDAPESAQRCTRDGRPYRCGAEAANGLDQFIGGRTVACTQRDTDRYGRIVAVCRAGGEDLSAWLIRQGLAVRYERYAGRAYLREERAAQESRRGLWSGEFDLPEDWRRRR